MVQLPTPRIYKNCDVIYGRPIVPDEPFLKFQLSSLSHKVHKIVSCCKGCPPADERRKLYPTKMSILEAGAKTTLAYFICHSFISFKNSTDWGA